MKFLSAIKHIKSRLRGAFETADRSKNWYKVKRREDRQRTQPTHSRLGATKPSRPAAPQCCVLLALLCVLRFREVQELGLISASPGDLDTESSRVPKTLHCKERGRCPSAWHGSSPSILPPQSRGFGPSQVGGVGLLLIQDNVLG